MVVSVAMKYLSIDNEGTHLMVEGLVNGLKASLIIDTGASRTVFDLKRITHYQPDCEIKKNNKFFSGIGAGNIDTYLTTIKTLQLGEAKIRDLAVVLFDLKVINQSYAMFDLPKIDGVLGGDVLKAKNAVVDYKNGLLFMDS